MSALLVATVGLSACTSKSKAKAQAQAAFMAGQREAMIRLQQHPNQPVVTLIGPVQSPTIPWKPDLTLARAIVMAGYRGSRDPSQIMIVRNGQAIPVPPSQLLSGEDVPLQSGDLIQLAP